MELILHPINRLEPVEPLENYKFITINDNAYTLEMRQMNNPLDAKLYKVNHKIRFLYGNILTILFMDFFQDLKISNKYQFIRKFRKDFALINKISKEINNELFIASSNIKLFKYCGVSPIYLILNKKYRNHSIIDKDFQFNELKRVMFNDKLKGDYPCIETDEFLILKYEFKSLKDE